MKNKALAVIVLCAVIVLPLLFLLIDFGSINFSLNIKKYRSENVDKLTFDFYGSFGSVHKLRISDENGTLCSLSVRIDAEQLEECENPVLIFSLMENGQDALLVLSSADEDGDIHRTPFVRNGNSYASLSDIDAVNARIENNRIICEERIFKYRAETRDDYEVPYEVWAKHTEYILTDGTLIPERALYVTYYSDSHIYCIGNWEYNANYGELMSTDENWLSPEKYAQIYGELSQKFEIELPE